MVFTSPTFLFIFLPLTLFLYFLSRRIATSCSNYLLLAASLLFYAWGEQYGVLILLASALLNHGIGLFIQKHESEVLRRRYLYLGIAANLSVLVYYKYTGFFLRAVQDVSGADVAVPNITLLLGISFFTFQAMSYLVDIYRGDAKAQKNPCYTALYICLFPQLIAGPIVRYASVAKQIESRKTTLTNFDCGVLRFTIGLAKKVLLANSFAILADTGFNADPAHLTPLVAWVTVAAYTLQIYFDFSGYSDMAIGLGHFFGFHFPENFRYPYIARSIRDFWRRWHISLSTWFRDYLYIPLGGSQHGPYRTYANLWIVFVLCGLWHGAQYTFLVWGVYHGGFLVIERLGLLRWLEACPKVIQHSYCLLVVMIGWVFFRADSISHAQSILSCMIGLQSAVELSPQIASLISRESMILFLVGAVAATPLSSYLYQYLEAGASVCRWRKYVHRATEVVSPFVLAGLLFMCFGSIAQNNYDPFIYFRF